MSRASGHYGGYIAAPGVMITSLNESSSSWLYSKHFEKSIASLFQGTPPVHVTGTSDATYSHLIGAYLPARALCALREVDSCHKQAYDQYLVDSVRKEILGQDRHDVSQLEAAVHIVAQIAKVGDASVIAAMAALLAHRHDRVRKAAVSAFPRIVARGDLGAIAAVAELVGHTERTVRHAALNALAEIAERGHGATIAVVIAAFYDSERCVRGAAVSAFAQIAEKGNAPAIAAVVGLLEDLCTNVRCAALHTLAQIVD